MWDPAEGEVTFDGQYFRADHLVTEPKPARRPPVLVGGAGERVTLRIAAEQADIWNNLAGHQADLAHKVDVLHRHCRDVGRDPAAITISQQCLVMITEHETDVPGMIATAQKIFGGHMGDPAGPLAIAGAPAQVRERIQAHIDLGCTMFVMEFFGRDTLGPADLFARTVLPHFR